MDMNMDRGRTKLAGGMDRLGDRLERKGRSFEKGDGFKRKGGRAIERAGQKFERGAEYLRTHPVDQIRSDAQFKIRERPLTTVAVALGAGYLLGRIFG